MQRLRLLHWSLYTQLECKIIKKFNRFDMIALEASGLNGGWMSLWYANGANSLAHFAWLNATFVLFYFSLFLAMKVFFFKWIIVSLISNYCCSCCWWVFFLVTPSILFAARQQLSGWKGEWNVAWAHQFLTIGYGIHRPDPTIPCTLTICFSCKL